MPTLSSVWSSLEREALDAGAVAIGASPLADEHVEIFERWLEEGHDASMAWMRKNLDRRRNPLERFPWGRSVVAITVPYVPDRPEAPSDSIASRTARYAQGEDYHDVLDGILRRLEGVLHASDSDARTWRYVDTGPFSDRSFAAQSGLGWIGKNAMLIDERRGSWLFIGTLVTSLEHDLPRALAADRCGTCTRCIEACPTGAILPGRIVDSGRCISHTTIELRGPIPESLAAVAGNVFGCDICQEVCPWNRDPVPGHPAFAPREAYRATPVTDLLTMSQTDFSALFRRSPIKRAKLEGMKRNAALVLAESSR